MKNERMSIITEVCQISGRAVHDRDAQTACLLKATSGQSS